MTTELLAPAGGQEALVAAVQSGADAVYMGFGAFNARRSARNFSDEEFRAAVMQSGTAQKDEFSVVRESFAQKVAELKGLAADGGRALENVFSFCEKAFADGDEILIFVTELTANYYSARFIGRYGCDRYYMHNKQLQFDQRQQEIIKRMDEIQWTV